MKNAAGRERQHRNQRRGAQLRQSILAGMLGGMAGAVAMSQFSRLWDGAFPASSGSPKNTKLLQFPAHRERGQPLMFASQQEWDSTMNAANAVARVLRYPLSELQEVRGAVAIHYAVGAALGGVYGAVREFIPEAGAVSGLAFGVAVWLAVEETGMPLLGWTRPPRRYTPAMHANSFGEHIAFGVTTELVRQVARRLV